MRSYTDEEIMYMQEFYARTEISKILNQISSTKKRLWDLENYCEQIRNSLHKMEETIFEYQDNKEFYVG